MHEISFDGDVRIIIIYNNRSNGISNFVLNFIQKHQNRPYNNNNNHLRVHFRKRQRINRSKICLSAFFENVFNDLAQVPHIVFRVFIFIHSLLSDAFRLFRYTTILTYHLLSLFFIPFHLILQFAIAFSYI